MNICDYLQRGKENKTSTGELCAITGLSQREVCKAVERERKNGGVILSSSSGGYWLPSIKDEDLPEQLERFIRFMQSKNTFETTASAEKLLKHINDSDQLKLEL